MDKPIVLDLFNPDQIIFQGTVARVQVPGAAGSFEMLYNHAPLISTLTKGKIRVVDLKGEVTYYDVSSGVVEVANNHITILMGI